LTKRYNTVYYVNKEIKDFPRQKERFSEQSRQTIDKTYDLGGKSMKDHSPSSPGAYDSDSEDEFLLANDAHIRSEARRAMPSGLFHAAVLDLETDDFAQELRIKLWASHQKRCITHPKAYIKTIAYTTAIDLVRHHKPTVSLFDDTGEEPGPGDFLVAQSEGLQDPLYEIESGEIDPHLLKKLTVAILALPARQKQAVLYALTVHKYDALPLLCALKAQGTDIEAGDWLEDEREVHLLNASLMVARKKLKYLLAEFMED